MPKSPKRSPRGRGHKAIKSEPRSPRPAKSVKVKSERRRSPSPKAKSTNASAAPKPEWSPKGHVAKGWNKAKPNSKGERRLIAELGDANICFLDPANLKYPICPKVSPGCKKGNKKCVPTPTCQGITGAALRARLQRNPTIQAKAELAALAMHCD